MVLRQLAEIEEYLTDEFFLFAKACKNGIYRRVNRAIKFIPAKRLMMKHRSGWELWLDDMERLFVNPEDWALTREELEEVKKPKPFCHQCKFYFPGPCLDFFDLEDRQGLCMLKHKHTESLRECWCFEDLIEELERLDDNKSAQKEEL